MNEKVIVGGHVAGLCAGCRKTRAIRPDVRLCRECRREFRLAAVRASRRPELSTAAAWALVEFAAFLLPSRGGAR